MSSNLFQSTHPRGVRQALVDYADCGIIISIHAPTRGATSDNFTICAIYALFQSTHPRGVRLFIYKKFYKVIQFQSTHPRGVRPATISGNSHIDHFNPRTHEGCDSISYICILSMLYFNPRTHEGCDNIIRIQSSDRRLFQSTHPRGVRRTSNDPLLAPSTSFQSTHPRGVRP